MSSLSRYKKSGGFVQLLSLIETFGPQKREKFLEMIEGESPIWANAIRDKMLSVDRIFGWNEQVVIEIFKRLPPKGQAFAITGLKEEYKAKINHFFTPSETRRMNDVLTESKPKPDEVASTLLKIVEVARKMIVDREIKLDVVDPALVVPEEYEARLEEQGATAYAQNSAVSVSEKTSHVAADPVPAPTGQAGAEVYQLQRSLGVLLKENKSLKDEVRTLRDKLEQIRKIA